MAGWKITIFDRRYILIHGCFFHCHVGFPGCTQRIAASTHLRMEILVLLGPVVSIEWHQTHWRCHFYEQNLWRHSFKSKLLSTLGIRSAHLLRMVSWNLNTMPMLKRWWRGWPLHHSLTILLMAEILHHLGWCWNPINNGKNYQPQLLSRISAINSMTGFLGISCCSLPFSQSSTPNFPTPQNINDYPDTP